MKRIIIIIVAMLLLSSCKTTKVQVLPEANVSKDTVYLYKSWRDSIYLHDSVWIETVIKGDTIYKTKDVYKIEYRDRYVYDTTYISKCDTITQKVVTNELTKWQKTQIEFGKFSIIIILAFCIGIAARYIKKFVP